MNEQELREALAAYAHEAWSGWMRYLFDRGELHPDGSFTIPVELVLHWQRQMRTPYMELPEDEKRSDRKEADEMLAIFAQSHAAALLRAVEGLGAAPDGDAFASVMEHGARCSLVADHTAPDNRWRVSRQCASGDIEDISEHPDFATALIALAAQIGAGNA